MARHKACDSHMLCPPEVPGTSPLPHLPHLLLTSCKGAIAIAQPRAKPWDRRRRTLPALKGRHRPPRARPSHLPQSRPRAHHGRRLRLLLLHHRPPSPLPPHLRRHPHRDLPRLRRPGGAERRRRRTALRPDARQPPAIPRRSGAAFRPEGRDSKQPGASSESTPSGVSGAVAGQPIVREQRDGAAHCRRAVHTPRDDMSRAAPASLSGTV